MNPQHIASLQNQLALEQKKMGLILDIDHIRDSAPEPDVMLTAIANALADHLHADFCSIALVDRDTHQLELKAITNRSLYSFDLNRALAEQASHLTGITIWDKNQLQQETLPETWQIAAVPIIMGTKERLGAMMLVRDQVAFSPDDINLLEIAESAIDSAVVQGYAYYDLKQKNKELAAIYRIDHIRDQRLPFNEMLTMILSEVCQATAADVVFAMLYDNSGKQLELRATTHNDLFQIATYQTLVEKLAHESLQEASLIHRINLAPGMDSFMCLPLILNNAFLGVLGVINRQGQAGFLAADQRLLTAIGSQIDTAIFESIEKNRLRQVLGRAVDPRIMERLLANPDVSFLKGERMLVTVLYADLRGSTQLAERTEPELLVGFINHYLGQMTEVILDGEGTLDKFVGDEVMALFGAPYPQADQAIRAVRVALAMQQAHQTIMEIWLDRDIEPAPIGIGIATGELIVGEMGSPQRSDFTVIGNAANLGARICSAAKAGEVLISQETYNLIEGQVEVTPITGLQLKGVGGNVIVYRVEGVGDA